MKLSELMILEQYENYTLSKNPLIYRTYIPKNKMDAYNLVFYMHGAGERGNDGKLMIDIHSEFIKRIIDHPVYSRNTIVIAVQVPENETWIPLEDIFYGTYSYDNNKATDIQLIFNDFIENEVFKRYKINKQSVHIVGISMGASGAIDYLTRYPNLFKSCIAICGTLDSEKLEIISKTPTWYFHSSDDTLVSYLPYKNNFSKIYNFNNNNRYTEYNDTGHGVWVKAFKEPELLNFLFK